MQSPVTKRLVFFCPGYDPLADSRYRRLIGTGLAQLARRFGVERHIGPVERDDSVPAVRWTIVRDQNLAFEMFKKGDFDVFQVNRSRQWVEELNFDKVQNGLIQKTKVFNDKPEGLQGFPMNTRRAPFDDIRVRKALALLFHREQLLEKLFFNEYLPDNSYYPGTGYYVYDTYRQPHVMTTTQRQYWASRSPALRSTNTTTRTALRPNWSGFNRQTAQARQTAREERQTTREQHRQTREEQRASRKYQ